jgi:hypothetical protein
MVKILKIMAVFFTNYNFAFWPKGWGAMMPVAKELYGRKEQGLHFWSKLRMVRFITYHLFLIVRIHSILNLFHADPMMKSHPHLPKSSKRGSRELHAEVSY